MTNLETKQKRLEDADIYVAALQLTSKKLSELYPATAYPYEYDDEYQEKMSFMKRAAREYREAGGKDVLAVNAQARRRFEKALEDKEVWAVDFLESYIDDYKEEMEKLFHQWHSMEKFIDLYNHVYSWIYESEDDTKPYRQEIEDFDNGKYSKFVLKEFNQARGDFVSSDREAAAFMLTYNHIFTNRS